MKKIIMRSRSTANLAAVISLLCLLAFGLRSGYAAPAPNPNSVLILGSAAKNASSSLEGVQAAQAGFTVVVASDTDWAAMTTSDFASYKEIIFGDGMCSGNATLKAAVANQAVWGPAVTGNVIVVGNHPAEIGLETPAATTFIQSAIGFAAKAEGTGAYINMGCFMSSSKSTDIPVLSAFGQFSAVRQSGCSSAAHLVASDPSLSALDDTSMSGWACTSNVQFLTWPSSFVPLVVATDVPGQFEDSATSATVSPYMLVRGAQVTPLTTLQTAPANQSTPIANSAPAPGDPTVDLSMPMSGNYDFFNDTINLLSSNGDWGLSGHFQAGLSWKPQSDISVQWDSTKMQQGESPGTTDTLNPGHGDMCVGFTASLDGVLDGHSLTLASTSQQICGDCPLATDGSPQACNLDTQYIQLFCGGVPPGVSLVEACISLTLALDSNVTPDQFATDRTVFYDSTAEAPSTLSFPPNPINDPVNLSCITPPGTDVTYQLANPRSSPHVGFSLVLGVAGQVGEFCIGDDCANWNTVFDQPLVTLGPFGDIPLNLTGPTKQVDLGLVQKENSYPDLTNVTASYTGNEGSPIQFTASGAKDNCLAYANVVWNFSDQGIAFGLNPLHTFQDADTFSGQLVVTNVGGNQSTKALTIKVNNVAPVVSAGPDTTAPWGVPVAFNGSGTAPGANDQATLVYSWAFGDGTPSATGGPSVFHAYSLPGTYTATLNVCDEDQFCNSASRQVVVRKRNVTLGYLGDQQGVYNTLTNLSGSLVDELGHAVPGRNVVFAIGAEAGGAAATNSTGLSSTTHLLGLPAGSYVASATFGGDGFYNAAVPNTAVYIVNRKPTSVTYTGVLNGGPNKTIALSAVLVDSQNHPLAGKVIAFKLGSQSASATTNASGVAATTLALNQKNASYPLTATYTPAGTDMNLYLGSVASATFKIQVK